MREIKFRAWEKPSIKEKFKGKMWDFDHIGDIRLDKLNNDEYVYMQYTGLKDKNEKEIYEGDICKYAIFDHNDNDSHFIGTVNWLGTEFIITQIPDTNNNGEYGANLGWVQSQYEEMEVIGNIYENPELLSTTPTNLG